MQKSGFFSFHELSQSRWVIFWMTNIYYLFGKENIESVDVQIQKEEEARTP